MGEALTIVGSFLAGSIPFGLIVGRLFFGTDIRSAGSGNIGAANALRTYGRAGGAAVLVLDALKGFVPALGAALWFGPRIAALSALAAVLGHVFSPWLRFRGGKGVATYLGALLAVFPLAAAAFALVWLVVALRSRFASLSSLTATLVSAAVVTIRLSDVVVTAAYAAAVATIFWAHRANVSRLRAGREVRLSFGRGTPQPRA